MKKIYLLFFLSLSHLCVLTANAQDVIISGIVSSDNKSCANALIVLSNTLEEEQIFTNDDGAFLCSIKESYPIILTVVHEGYTTYNKKIFDNESHNIIIELSKLSVELSEAEIEEVNESGVEWLNSIQNGNIYRGIKSSVIRLNKEIIVPGEVQARSVFNKIPGVNVWESDAAGLQIGIGVRGLSPNRLSYISVRQNGSPIAADPLGYPESYYTPSLESVEKIEYVSGASALQYGSQLGGMLDFKMKEGRFNMDDHFRFISSSTFYISGDSNLRNNRNFFFESQGGSEKKAHYLCYDLKKGDGWRSNTDFRSQNFYLALKQSLPIKTGEFIIREEITIMNRVEHQPGGLTDLEFLSTPQLSKRDRNWFSVDWRIFNLSLAYKPFSSKWMCNLNVFKLDAQRSALGIFGEGAAEVDYGEDRTLISSNFNTGGFDLRATKILKTNSNQNNALVFGIQGYHGLSNMQVGLADSTSEPNFNFLNPDNLEGSSYDLPNTQLSAFSKAIIMLNDKFSISPGIRWEYIETKATGWYRVLVSDLAGNVIQDLTFDNERNKSRHVLLPGISFSYKSSPKSEIYANAVSNYRAINFSDIQIQNLGIIIDPDIDDEQGANFDLGYRKNGDKISFDISAFYLKYSNKIGVFPTSIPDPLLGQRVAFLRTNIADARTYGLESILSIRLFSNPKYNGRFFVNSAYMNGAYMDSKVFNKIENTPNLTTRLGFDYSSTSLKVNVLWSYVSSQYTDATNSIFDPNAVYGEIPSYEIFDLSINYNFPSDNSIGIKVNNLFNNIYFTRRATGYPGPGIIPSDGRSIRISLVINNL